jgi:alpha-tubulin suppressor-like RCC1 family protein
MLPVLAMLGTLALGVVIAGPATAGDDGPRVGQHADTRISASLYHACAVKANGDIDCWGLNVATYLDFGQATDQTGPYVQVSARSEGHTCAIKANGDVGCWGLNEDGQATDQTGPYVQVSAGGVHTCALKANGDIHCWGNNFQGQAADQTGPYIQVSAGASHTCAVKASGAVDCWG